MATVGLSVDLQFGSNGSATTEVDRSTYVRSVDFPREQDVLDTTPFGVTARTYAVGLMDNKMTVEFFWDTTIDTHLNALLGYTTAVEFIYGPDGTTSGRPKFTGTVFCKSVSEPTTVGEVKMFTCEFQSTGTLTRTTY
jgi:hypothetical protein